MPRSPREDLPRFIEPMLARSGPMPEREGGWVAEAKWDGCRLQVRFDGKRLCLRTRPGRDCTADFPELDPLADALAGRRVVLDGELVCLDCGGRPDFGQLRSRRRHRRRGSALHAGQARVLAVGASNGDSAVRARDRQRLGQRRGPDGQRRRHFG
jgi:ATP-dependent DNA ligase